MATIEFEGVSFEYSHGSPILRDIDLCIGPDDGLTCIVGPNGVGKSTLVRCMNRLLKPTMGRVTLSGADLNGMSRAEIASRVAYVPALSGDMASMTVFDMVLMGRYGGRKWRTDGRDVKLTRMALATLGVDDLADRYVSELSAGQYQKVALARGLVQETDFLLLDEPTSNLDLRSQVYVASLMRGIARNEGMSVVMISHDINIASKFADRIIMMGPPGVVVADGHPTDIVTRGSLLSVYGIDCDVTLHEGRPSVQIRSDSARSADSGQMDRAEVPGQAPDLLPERSAELAGVPVPDNGGDIPHL